MVAPPGLEPGSPYGRQILSLLRIPISPWGPKGHLRDKRLTRRSCGVTIMPKSGKGKELRPKNFAKMVSQKKTAAPKDRRSKLIKLTGLS